MMISDRFAKLWEAWDTHLKDHTANEFLVVAKDEELIELLAGESAKNRKFERDIIATEVLNRLHRRQTNLPMSADAALRAAEMAALAAEAGQAAIHTCEALLHAAGDHELGQAISLSAYESLDATKLALNRAQHHAAEVQLTLSQSRLSDKASSVRREKSDTTAEAASQAAHRGSDLTDDLETRMARIGKRAEGRAAAQAGRAISDAADAGAVAARDAITMPEGNPSSDPSATEADDGSTDDRPKEPPARHEESQA